MHSMYFQSQLIKFSGLARALHSSEKFLSYRNQNITT